MKITAGVPAFWHACLYYYFIICCKGSWGFQPIAKVDFFLAKIIFTLDLELVGEVVDLI